MLWVTTGYLMAAIASVVILVASWGGIECDWGSPTILSLIAPAVAYSALFGIAE